MSTLNPAENVVALRSRTGELVQQTNTVSIQDRLSQLPPEVQDLFDTAGLRTEMIRQRKQLAAEATYAELALLDLISVGFVSKAAELVQLEESIANDKLRQLAERCIDPLIEKVRVAGHNNFDLAQAEFERVQEATLTDELYIRQPDPVPHVEYEDIKLPPMARLTGRATVPVKRFDNRRYRRVR